ncbi:hypothetical protein LTR12_003217 [Friedmanniomyces endolithicus]|nr:hypothetical protein LTR12_003217 [Friedmanniomyces endolithicus]
MPSFLDLPPELRNWVYSNVFANPEDRVTVVNESHEHWLAVARTGVLTSRRRYALALLATNRQIRAEAYGYAYGGVAAYAWEPAWADVASEEYLIARREVVEGEMFTAAFNNEIGRAT